MSIRIPRLFFAVGLTLVLAQGQHAAAQRQGDPLAPTVQCVAQGRFGIREVGRLPESSQARTVATRQGPRRVTLFDGYRMLLTTAQGEPFVNLKIEASRPEAVATDREAVVEQMTAMAEAASRQLNNAFADGVETLALHQPSLERPGPVSFYSLVVPARAIIVTAYVLNQPADRRAFNTYAEYEQLRDEAIGLVRNCLLVGG